MSTLDYAVALAQKAQLKKGCTPDQKLAIDYLVPNKGLLGLLFATHDKKEGMTAFLERRKPNFTDF